MRTFIVPIAQHVDYLVNYINYAFGKGPLSVTQWREIIKLKKPKKDAEPDLIKTLS